MKNFMISFEVVFPIFLMMALGFLIRRIRLVNETTLKQMNSVVFRVFLPVMIFKNVYESKIEEVLNPRLLTFAVLSVLACVGILFVLIPLVEKDNARRGVMIQAIFRSNFVIFGLPVGEALCGGGVSGMASVLIAVIIPIFNVFAVISLSVFQNKKANLPKVLKGIVTNPLIIASVLGLLVSLCGISFPKVVEKAMGSVSSVTTPLALIILGASINFGTVGKNAWRLVAGVGARLILVPAVFLSLAIFVFGFRGAELAILLALFASPAATSSFTMAQQMGGDEQLAGQLVMFGTTISIFTVFLWIFLLVQMGWV